EAWESDNNSVDSQTPEDIAYERRIAEQRCEVVRKALSQLPDRCKDLITMLYYLNEKPTYEDVAKRLNMPVSSIGPTRGRCLEKLKKILGDAF
ncbi:MAG TPA: sigma-70 family RNA polymerase sigma factor, partial [Blastocatellia bacterium]|nr:sigma-70 family RNA polymerase sigma factor [Blastocatellia bacterium]